MWPGMQRIPSCTHDSYSRTLLLVYIGGALSDRKRWLKPTPGLPNFQQIQAMKLPKPFKIRQRQVKTSETGKNPSTENLGFWKFGNPAYSRVASQQSQHQIGPNLPKSLKNKRKYVNYEKLSAQKLGSWGIGMPVALIQTLFICVSEVLAAIQFRA